MKKVRISLHYYRAMAPFCLLITMACAFILVNLMDVRAIPLLVFFKVLTLFLFFLFTTFLRPKEFFYYYNLGVPKTLLWGTAVVIDGAVFAVIIILTNILYVK